MTTCIERADSSLLPDFPDDPAIETEENFEKAVQEAMSLVKELFRRKYFDTDPNQLEYLKLRDITREVISENSYWKEGKYDCAEIMKRFISDFYGIDTRNFDTLLSPKTREQDRIQYLQTLRRRYLDNTDTKELEEERLRRLEHARSDIEKSF